MTEAEWRSAVDPLPMLEFVRGKISDRKLRLYACACCRRMWHLLRDDGGRKAIEASELYADRQITQQQLAAACGVARKIERRASKSLLSPMERPPELVAIEAARDVARSALLKVRRARLMAELPAMAVHRALAVAEVTISNRPHEQSYLANLLRDVAGNPFALGDGSVAFLSVAVLDLGRAIYDGQLFDQMPILADAVEDAGCSDAALLAHLRGPGPHAKGCWALDLVLGRR
jgi:hypothetical protein